MLTSSSRWAMAFLITAAAACSDGTSLRPSDAELKVVHASTQVGAIDVTVGGVAAASGLAYGQSSPVVNVPSGPQLVVVRSGGAQVTQFTVTLGTSHRNALTFGSDTAQVSPVTPDTGQPIANRANVRLINVASANTSDPTLLQLNLNFPGVSADSTAVIGFDAKAPRHGSLMYFNPGRFVALLAPQGPTRPLLAEVEFDVAAGAKKAIVVERAESGSYTMRVVSEP